jgi:branched-chain amino acid transport system permease protein
MFKIDRTVIGLTLALVLLLVADFFLPEWVRFTGLQSLARGVVALGLLVLWRPGLISFGHALFFGWGAYTAALLTRFEVTTDAFVLVFAAAGSAGLLAFGLGFLLRRYRAIFFALLNMAFSMILYGALVKTEALGSTDGFGVASPTYLGYAPEGEAVQTTLFAFTCVFTYLLALAVHVYLQTTLGYMTKAVRENEIRVEYLGYSAERVIHIKYVISGLLAGFGGAIMAMAIGQVDPDSMAYWTVSGDFVFITILSGTGNVSATFIGALVFELLRTYAFEYAPHFWQLILGGGLLAIIMFLPDGLWSLAKRLRRSGS